MIDKCIEVVTTDTTGMKETAFGSVETSCKLFEILKKKYANVTFNVIENVAQLNEIALRKPDLVVCCVKYFVDVIGEQDIWLSAFFAERGIAHTGSTREALRYDSDKASAKRAVTAAGLPTAAFFIAGPGEFQTETELPLPFPLFVKPIDAANGNGIDAKSLVLDFDSYVEKVAEIDKTYYSDALVEEYLMGREFTVSVLDNATNGDRLISPIEIIVPANTNGDRILGCFEKTQNNEALAIVSTLERAVISRLVDKVFTALGARDFGRIDIKMNGNNSPYFMEANLVPGMTPGTSYFPRACFYEQGMSYDEVVFKIVELALLRSQDPVVTPPTDIFPLSKVAT